MGIFDSIRNIMSNASVEELHWLVPENTDEIDAIFNTLEKPQIIYKHSYRCGTALFTKRSLDSGIEEIAKHADIYMVDVVAMRDMSVYIAKKSGLKHESPQIILLHKGKPFWHKSHGGVRIEKLKDALSELIEPEPAAK